MTCYFLTGFVCLSLVAQTIRLNPFLHSNMRTLMRLECKKGVLLHQMFQIKSESLELSMNQPVWVRDPNLTTLFFRRKKLSTSGSTKSDSCRHRIHSLFFGDVKKQLGKSPFVAGFFPRVAQSQKKKNIDLCPCPRTKCRVCALQLGSRGTKRAEGLSIDTSVVQLVLKK